MNTLVLIYNRKEPRADSRLLAERLGINHKSLISQIKRYKTDFEEFGLLPFKRAKADGMGRPQNVIYLNEDQSTLILTYSKNTSKVRKLKKQLVKAFSFAKKQLQARKDGIRPRIIAMDSVNLLIEQAERQGSKNAKKYYSNITQLTYRTLFGSTSIDRDSLSTEQLDLIAECELKIKREIATLLKENPEIYYKDIYKGIKGSLKAFEASIKEEH